MSTSQPVGVTRTVSLNPRPYWRGTRRAGGMSEHHPRLEARRVVPAEAHDVPLAPARRIADADRVPRAASGSSARTRRARSAPGRPRPPRRWSRRAGWRRWPTWSAPMMTSAIRRTSSRTGAMTAPRMRGPKYRRRQPLSSSRIVSPGLEAPVAKREMRHPRPPPRGHDRVAREEVGPRPPSSRRRRRWKPRSR